MHVAWKSALALAVMIGAGNQAVAQNFSPPASGLLILDLAGSPIIPAYTQYSASFTATASASTVTFVFRHDPGFFGFDDASVMNATIPGGNLLLNPGFEEGAPTSSGGGAPDWTYFQQDGISNLGFEAETGTDGLTAHGGAFFWDDGATGGYDGIDQTIPTTVGDVYNVSFYLTEINSNGFIPPGDDYQQTCTNGLSGTDCDGIDALVYAGDGLPPTSAPPDVVPEPASLALLGFAAGSLVVFRRRRGDKARNA